jgi:heptosyltransferase-3
VIISGAHTLSDQTLNTEIITSLSESAAQTVTNMTGKLTLSELGTLLKHAKAYIGVDTAITHLAAACNTPTIALFGPTPPSNFGPWPNGFRGEQPYLIRASSQTQQHITILQGTQDCVPCRKAGCEDHANSPSACLNELSLERVLTALDTTLQNLPKRDI